MKIDDYIHNYREFSQTRDKHVLGALGCVGIGIVLGTGTFLVLQFFVPSIPDILFFGTKTVIPFSASVGVLSAGVGLTVTALHYHKKVKEVSIKNLLDALKEKRAIEHTFAHMEEIYDKDYIDLLRLIDRKYFSGDQDVRLGKRLKRIFWAIGTGSGGDKFIRNCYEANVSEAFIKKMGKALDLLHMREGQEETYGDVLYRKIKEEVGKNKTYLDRISTFDPERDRDRIGEFLSMGPIIVERKHYLESILSHWKRPEKPEEVEKSSSASQAKGQRVLEMDMGVEEYSSSDENGNSSESEASSSEKRDLVTDEYLFQEDSPEATYTFSN